MKSVTVQHKRTGTVWQVIDRRGDDIRLQAPHRNTRVWGKAVNFIRYAEPKPGQKLITREELIQDLDRTPGKSEWDKFVRIAKKYGCSTNRVRKFYKSGNFSFVVGKQKRTEDGICTACRIRKKAPGNRFLCGTCYVENRVGPRCAV